MSKVTKMILTSLTAAIALLPFVASLWGSGIVAWDLIQVPDPDGVRGYG